jgi:hypothetical protein
VAGVGEAGDVADLGHKNCRRHPAHAVDGLDSPVTAVAGQAFVGLAVGDVDLVVEDLDQVAQRVDPVAVGLVEGHLLQQHLAPGAEHVVQLGEYAALGHHGVDLGLGQALAEVRRATSLAR